MFGKKKCNNCNRKIEKDFEYCPYCAKPLHKKDYGLLGKDDYLGGLNEVIPNNFGGMLGSSFIEKMMSNAIKMVEREMQKGVLQENNLRRTRVNKNLPGNFELFINGKKVSLPGNIEGIQIENMPATIDENKKSSSKSKIPKVSEETMQKSAKLPRKEAKSHLIRTSDKVIYELDTPGLLSLNHVLVNKLENSIEIKAYTDKAVYFKTLPVKLTLMQYSLKEDKLVLEFKA
jgi:hypothetical protein